jgi:hypothetical protein
MIHDGWKPGAEETVILSLWFCKTAYRQSRGVPLTRAAREAKTGSLTRRRRRPVALRQAGKRRCARNRSMNGE